MGLPGDSLYFYGGRIYGVDKDGNDIPHNCFVPGMEKLEWVPYNTFEGRPSVSRSPEGGSYEVIFRQVNRPVGRFSWSSYGIGEGQIYNGTEWIAENLQAANQPHDKIETYMDFLGMRNFAMARLLTKQEVKAFSGLDPSAYGEADLYLELRHNPNLTKPQASDGRRAHRTG